MSKGNQSTGYQTAQHRIASALQEDARTLNLTRLELTSLPAEISSLTSLQTLNLRSNQLTSLPAESASLTSLQYLDFSGNQLTSLPAEIASLTSLKHLNLSGNQLTSLPAEIGELTSLQYLDLSSNRLTSLPAGIALLTSLQNLYLYGNQITSLPAEIGELTSLQNLYIAGNQITSLPAGIASLTSLQNLYLAHNQITSLPAGIASLTSLQNLDLEDNQITSLPAEIASLTSLRTLDLRSNQITSLPAGLRELTELEILLLHGNSNLGLSPNVLGPDPGPDGMRSAVSASSILAVYFGRLASHTRPLNEVKLILVGRGGAGKTSVVRALRGLPFRSGEASTPGIALSDWPLKGCKGGDVTAHVWDFAGQVITHALHQFFFSVRSVYTLVLTGRENSEREDAEYWLRLIKAFGTEENGEGPPVIIALNKWDVKGCRPKVDRGALKERYPFIREFVEVDCKSKKGVAKLRTALNREVARLKWVREPFKASWDEVRRALTRGRKTAPYLPYDEFRKLCEQLEVTNKSEQDSLAEVLHNLGSALNYRNDPRLREATVLKPQWLTKHVYTLLRRAEKQSGVLSRSDVDTALVGVTDTKMRDYLIRLMERFEIAYPSRTSSAATWLVPQALPDVQPKGAEAFAAIGSEATRLRYSYQALPEGLVARVIVRLHEFIEDANGKRQQWASGAILIREGARALIRTEPQDRQVMITVIGPADARRQLAGLCQAEIRDIHREIQGLNPLEETQVDNAWVATATLEADERSGQKTGVSTMDRGTVSIDPAVPNDAYSLKDARVEEVWKPTAFICYSKENTNQRKRLESELKILKNEGLLAGHWHDRMIDPGNLWDQSIQKELASAAIFIVLLSNASLSTDYITETEIPNAMKLHDEGKTTVVPVVLKACRWDQTKLGALNAVPDKGKPIDKWKPQSEAWKSVADGLARVCQNLMSAADRRGKVRAQAPLKASN